MYYAETYNQGNEIHVFTIPDLRDEWVDEAWEVRCPLAAHTAREVVRETGVAYLHGRDADIPRSWRRGSCWDYEQTDDPNVDRTFDELKRYYR